MSKMKNFKRQQKLPAVLKTGTRTEEFTEWLKKHFEEKQDVGLPREQMYLLFRRYCNDISKQVECREIFGKLIAETFPSVYKRRLGGRSGMKYYYWSLDVKETSVYWQDLEKHRTSLPSDEFKNSTRLRSVKSSSSNEKKNKKNRKTDSSNLKEITNTSQFDLMNDTSQCSVLNRDVSVSENSEETSLAVCNSPANPVCCQSSQSDGVELSSSNQSDGVNVAESHESYHSGKTKDIAEPGTAVEQMVETFHAANTVTDGSLQVRRVSRRSALSGEASFSAQKRKASNCTCTDCGDDPKRKKSKVHRMSEILASPRMRSSLRQAIRASLAESSCGGNVAQARFVSKNRSSSTDADVHKQKRLEKSASTDSILLSEAQRSKAPTCEPEQRCQVTEDKNGDHNVADTQTNISIDEQQVHDGNQKQAASSRDCLQQTDNKSDQFAANPRIWRFLPPLLKKLHRERVKKWLGDEFEWSPPSCLPRHRVYQHYETFCNQNLSCAAPPATLGKMLQEKFKMLSMRRLGGRNSYKYYYKGIDIQPSSSAYDMLSKERILTSPKPKLSRVFNGLSKTAR